jgi:hypothetical protein
MAGEIENKPGEGAAAVDLTKYVPKEDLEKASSSVKELEAKLEEAKMSLLDPEYISFLEQKKQAKLEKKLAKTALPTDADLSKLTSAQVLSLSVEKAKEAIMTEIVPQYEEQLRRTQQTLSDVLAVLELQEVEKKYSDFSTYRDDTRKILETSTTPLTIEQAYKLAKANTFDGKAPAVSPAEKPTGSVPGNDMKPTSFKSKYDAAEDAWNRTVGPGKDII